MKEIILHIGTHKTGSTSIQRFLLHHPDYLARHGIALYQGQIHAANHRELDLASMRYERDSFQRLGGSKHITCDAAYTQHVTEVVQAFLKSCPQPRVVLTSEALSWIRYDDEIERLKSILDAGRNEITVVLYLRNKEDYLRSYTQQILKADHRALSADYHSCLYVGPDTWLTDFDTLVAKYRQGFGDRSLVIIDYDEEMRRFGNVIPSFLRVLGLEPEPGLDLDSYFYNTTDPALERKPWRAKRWLKTATQAWREWRKRSAA